MIVDILQLPTCVQISYINEIGNIDIINAPLPKDGYTNWILTTEEDPNASKIFTNHDGRPVKKEWGKKFYDLNLHEYIFHHMDEKIRKKVLAYNKPQFFSIDIETEITDEKPNPEKAKSKVLSVSITAPNMASIVVSLGSVDINHVQKLVNEALGQYANEEKFPCKHFEFETEKEMLIFLFDKMRNSLHCQGGWFYDGYDWPYLVNRAKRLNIDPKITSPISRLHSRDNKPYHRLVIDYMAVYKEASKGLYLTSFSLNAIAEYELGLTKLDSGMSLKKLYQNDYNKFIAYNIIDTILVQLIHRKTNKLDKYLNMSYYVGIPIQKAESQIAIIDSLIFKKLYSKKKVYAERKPNHQKTSFNAAYVKEPVRHEIDHPTGYDAKALYPSTIKTYDLSPERLIGKCKPNEVAGLRKQGFFVSGRNTVYKLIPGVPSLYKEIETDLGTERDQYKGSKAEIWEIFMSKLENEGKKRKMSLKSKSEYS